MSVQRIGVLLLCDGPSEAEECPDDANWMDAVPSSWLRSRAAREDGWTVALPGGIDRCAKCSKSSLYCGACMNGCPEDECNMLKESR